MNAEKTTLSTIKYSSWPPKGAPIVHRSMASSLSFSRIGTMNNDNGRIVHFKYYACHIKHQPALSLWLTPLLKSATGQFQKKEEGGGNAI